MPAEIVVEEIRRGKALPVIRFIVPQDSPAHVYKLPGGTLIARVGRYTSPENKFRYIRVVPTVLDALPGVEKLQGF